MIHFSRWLSFPQTIRYLFSDNLVDRAIRQNELDVLLKEIYPQISDRRYGNPLVAYTILLGDYNAELWTNESEIWQAPLKASRGGKKPAVMKTDGMGVVYSNQYDGRAIKTVQNQLNWAVSVSKMYRSFLQ